MVLEKRCWLGGAGDLWREDDDGLTISSTTNRAKTEKLVLKY